MDLGPGFQELLHGLSAVMTAPGFESLSTVASGWLYCGHGIVTRMIVAAGAGATKHFSAHHRVFSAASWSLDALGLALFTMMTPSLTGVVMLGLDDTLARRRGLRKFGTGMHHHPLALTRRRAFVRCGHSWVALRVIVSLPSRPGYSIFPPLLFQLHLNRQSDAQHGARYRTRPELGIEMLRILCNPHEHMAFACGRGQRLRRSQRACGAPSELRSDEPPAAHGTLVRRQARTPPWHQWPATQAWRASGGPGVDARRPLSACLALDLPPLVSQP